MGAPPVLVQRPARIALLSTYPPTQCGLATFSVALHAALARLPGEVGVLRVLERADSGSAELSPPEVVGVLVNGSQASAERALATLDGFDAVLLQHEYGIYGGPDGSDVLDLVEALRIPVVAVLHTVLAEPSPRQRHILARLIQVCAQVVTMTQTGRDRAVALYGADPTRVTVIPHGAAVAPLVTEAVRAGVPRRPVVLTWGLIGPGKGIEWAIDALPALRDLHPRYVVAGRTHPKVLERDGETYRAGLRARADALGVGDLLEFEDGYLDEQALAGLVRGADVVLLPYDSREQVTSGVLIEAVAAARPVVSTGFPHARELLGDGTGLVVGQGDAVAIEQALRRVLTEPGLASALSARAARKSPELLWSAVARRYREVVELRVTALTSAA